MSSYYATEELESIGLKSYGEGVLISKKVSFYGAATISVGNHVRIDDFCILSGSITLGSHIHIGAYCAMYGSKGIVMEDYTGLSPRCTVFSASDDFSGDYLISPMAPVEQTNVKGGLVVLKKYTQVGAGCIIMPDLEIGEGVSVGAMSFVNESLPEWTIYAGVPARKIKERKKGLLNFFEK